MSIYSEQPPTGAADAVWRITVDGTITYTLPLSPAAQAINTGIMEESTASVEAYIEPETHAVVCPECGADHGLIAEGNWRGDVPLRLLCPAGHRWTPRGADPDFGRGLMRQIILDVSAA
ncbi:hypothetical protein AB0E27_42780 [Streptomyces sparsogenes]|uniref:hypothetical protein n=1 Tax=Streptomyces sparsogenes TaxID=67365 RepID=UPI0034053FFA